MYRLEILLAFLAAATEIVSARISPSLIPRYLEQKGVDEDDDSNYSEPVQIQATPWYHLEHYLQKDSLAYDTVEGFCYVTVALLVLWIVWTCLVHCGICPDDRLDRRRDLRRVKDGRGVFSPVGQQDEVSDDDSEESMEFGHSHDGQSFGAIRMSEVDQDLEDAADKFFSKSDRHPKAKKSKGKKGGTQKKFLEIEQSEDFKVNTVFV